MAIVIKGVRNLRRVMVQYGASVVLKAHVGRNRGWYCIILVDIEARQSDSSSSLNFLYAQISRLISMEIFHVIKIWLIEVVWNIVHRRSIGCTIVCASRSDFAMVTLLNLFL